MPDQTTIIRSWKPTLPFYISLGLVMLALWIPFIPGAWSTFIHMWRVELAASVFLMTTLAFLYYRASNNQLGLSFSNDEWKFIVLPILAFILWSAVSMAWAPSWKSAAHHTLVWTEYLIFFCIVRYLVDRERNYGRLMTMFVFTLVLLAIPAILEYCAFLVFGGATTLGMRYAKWGEQIITLLPLALVGVLRLNGRRFLLGLSAVTAMWLLIFCSFGRINIFLFACGIVAVTAVVFIFRRFHKYRRKMSLAVVVLVIAPFPLHLFSFLSEDPEIPIVRRLGDTDGLNGSNNFRKLMVSISREMIAANPILGVGADNFGMQVNNYRAVYGTENPSDPNLVNAEDGVPSHAHNEFLQIIAELGIIGGLIFLSFLFGIAIMSYRALSGLRNGSLYPFAAVLGIGMFLTSSLVSAYSFRVMQNGFVFFFVLAVASRLLFKDRVDVTSGPAVRFSRSQFKLACAAGFALCFLLAVYSTARVSSTIITTRANYEPNFGEATRLYMLAMKLDNENPDARNNYGMRLFQQGCYADAVPHLAEAIRIGKGPSAAFSYLATAYTLSGDIGGAEKTFAEAAALYPQSPFVLTRYAEALRANGRSGESEMQLQRAMQINKRAANTWWMIINDGPTAASALAARSDDYLEIMDLQPQSSVYALMAERDIRYPDQRSAFKF